MKDFVTCGHTCLCFLSASLTPLCFLSASLRLSASSPPLLRTPVCRHPAVHPRRSMMHRAAAAAVKMLNVATGAVPNYAQQFESAGLGLEDPGGARILRDGHGVPTIIATTAADTYALHGVAVAHDRLWQLHQVCRNTMTARRHTNKHTHEHTNTHEQTHPRAHSRAHTLADPLGSGRTTIRAQGSGAKV